MLIPALINHHSTVCWRGGVIQQQNNGFNKHRLAPVRFKDKLVRIKRKFQANSCGIFMVSVRVKIGRGRRASKMATTTPVKRVAVSYSFGSIRRNARNVKLPFRYQWDCCCLLLASTLPSFENASETELGSWHCGETLQQSCALIKASLQTVQCLLFRMNFFLNLIFELKRRIVGCPIWNFSSFRNYFVQRYFRRCLSLSLKNRLAQLTVSTILLFPLSATKTCQNTKGSRKNSYISKMTKKVDGTVVTFLYQPNTI